MYATYDATDRLGSEYTPSERPRRRPGRISPWRAHRIANSANFAVALALVFAAITVVAVGNKNSFSADTAALPFSAKPGNETPVRATKGDRLDIRPEARKIAGVTVVLHDLGRTIR